MSNLGELDVQANKAREKRAAVARTGVGASRIGARSTVVEMPPAAPETTEASPVKNLTGAKSTAKSAQPADEPPSQSSISLDRKSDELLEAVRAAGRLGRPKVDANRSATIRLALAMLGEQMTPDEIAAELCRRIRHTGNWGVSRILDRSSVVDHAAVAAVR